MSAFVVADVNISAILESAKLLDYPGEDPTYRWAGEHHRFRDNLQRIAQVLLDENYRSVNNLYGEQATPHRFRSSYPGKFTPVELLKLLDFYEYQSCCTPGWKETEAYAIWHSLRERAIRHLPGYKQATWGIRG